MSPPPFLFPMDKIESFLPFPRVEIQSRVDILSHPFFSRFELGSPQYTAVLDRTFGALPFAFDAFRPSLPPNRETFLAFFFLQETCLLCRAVLLPRSSRRPPEMRALNTLHFLDQKRLKCPLSHHRHFGCVPPVAAGLATQRPHKPFLFIEFLYLLENFIDTSIIYLLHPFPSPGLISLRPSTRLPSLFPFAVTDTLFFPKWHGLFHEGFSLAFIPLQFIFVPKNTMRTPGL